MLFVKIYILSFLAIWLVAIIVAYGYGRVGRRINSFQKFASVGQQLPPLTVIIPAHNQATALRRHLPAILAQDYELFEVIVINTGSTDDTKDVIERFELQHANLHHSFTPLSARDISLDRLALTLGFRAANYEWVVITHADCEPASPNWLTRIGETIVAPQCGPQSKRLKGEPDIVVGQAVYAGSRHSWLGLKSDFWRLWTDFSAFDHLLTGHAAIGADGCNLAYRKQFFLEHQGFSDHHNLELGAEDLLVNHNSKPGNTALMLTPSATIVQDPLPDERTWKKQRLFACETRRHRRHALLYNSRERLRLTMPWLLAAVIVAGVILPFVVDLQLDTSTLYFALAAIVLMVIVYFGVKISAFNRTARALGYRRYYLSFLLFELRLPIWKCSDAIDRRRASRNEFRKKFV